MTTNTKLFLEHDISAPKVQPLVEHAFHWFLACHFSGYFRLVQYEDNQNGHISLKTSLVM